MITKEMNNMEVLNLNEEAFNKAIFKEGYGYYFYTHDEDKIGPFTFRCEAIFALLKYAEMMNDNFTRR